MTVDEAIKHLTNDWGKDMGGMISIDWDKSDEWIEAVGEGVKALLEKREAEKNIPLIPEELFRLNYEPIWISDLENERDSQWRICYIDLGKYFCSHGGKTNKGYLIQEYGKTWLAYRRPVI